MILFSTRHGAMSLRMILLTVWTHLICTAYVLCLIMTILCTTELDGGVVFHIPAAGLSARWWWSRGYWGGEISACRGGPWTGSSSYSPPVTPCSPQCRPGSTPSHSPANIVYIINILWCEYLYFFHLGLYKTYIMFWSWFLHSTFMRLEPVSPDSVLTC